MLPMNEYFANLTVDAGVTTISIVSDDAVLPCTRARSPIVTRQGATTSKKQLGSTKKFLSRESDDGLPSYPRRLSDDDIELLSAATLLVVADDDDEETNSNDTPSYLSTTSADDLIERSPPTVPRRKESIDLSFVDDSSFSSHSDDSSVSQRSDRSGSLSRWD